MYDENSNIPQGGGISSSCSSSIAATAAVLASNTSTTGIMSQLLNVKDSRWLQLEVCREFQRGQCSRSEDDCKFAHPPPHVDVQNGRVTACYDSIKGRCSRENPKCKYLHPPQHLKDQLLINGRNNLALKNLICTQLNQNAAAAAAAAAAASAVSAPTLSTMSPLAQLVVSGQASPATLTADPLLIVQQQQNATAASGATLVPATALPYQYYQGITTMYPTVVPVATSDAYQAQMQAQLVALQNLAAMQPASVPAAAAFTATTLPLSRKRALDDEHAGSSQHVDQGSLLLAAAAAAGAAGVPCKRPAAEKSGVPVYASGTPAAAHIAQMSQPTFSPYLIPGIHGYMPTVSFSGQIPPRF